MFEQALKYQFEYFFRKLFQKRKTLSEKDLFQINKFSYLLEKEYGDSIDEEWVYNYLLYQFSKYFEANTSFTTFQVSWVYSQSALKKYRERHPESDYFSNKFATEHNLNRRFEKESESTRLSEEYKEEQRKIFKKDLDRQLLHCIENLLFDEASNTCSFCKNRQICNQIDYGEE